MDNTFEDDWDYSFGDDMENEVQDMMDIIAL